MRDLIDEALKELRAKRGVLSLLSKTNKSLKAIRSSTIEAERNVTEAYVSLMDMLEAANLSAYAMGTDWVEVTEPAWESYNEKLRCFREAGQLENAIDFLLSALEDLSRIGVEVSKRLDSEVARFELRSEATMVRWHAVRLGRLRLGAAWQVS